MLDASTRELHKGQQLFFLEFSFVSEPPKIGKMVSIFGSSVRLNYGPLCPNISIGVFFFLNSNKSLWEQVKQDNIPSPTPHSETLPLTKQIMPVKPCNTFDELKAALEEAGDKLVSQRDAVN